MSGRKRTLELDDEASGRLNPASGPYLNQYTGASVRCRPPASTAAIAALADSPARWSTWNTCCRHVMCASERV